MSRTIVLVHGAWVTSESWATFRQPFETAGYAVHAPTWPGLDGLTGAAIKASPPPGFGSLTLRRIVDQYEGFIARLPEPPILIGHSFGGLITQLLLDRGLGVAGVAINPAPIGGIVPGPSALRAIAPILLRSSAWKRPYAFTRDRFGSLFANSAPEPLVDAAFADFVIPAPGMIFHQAALWLGTFVDPRRRTQPLLITGSSQDRLVSPYLSAAAFRKQRRAPGPTDYRFFEGLSHFLIAEPGWEQVADTVLSWVAALPQAGSAPEFVRLLHRRELAMAL